MQCLEIRKRVLKRKIHIDVLTDKSESARTYRGLMQSETEDSEM